jgi:hypothetical protein
MYFAALVTDNVLKEYKNYNQMLRCSAMRPISISRRAPGDLLDFASCRKGPVKHDCPA